VTADSQHVPATAGQSGYTAALLMQTGHRHRGGSCLLALRLALLCCCAVAAVLLLKVRKQCIKPLVAVYKLGTQQDMTSTT
jgi:hypothetical protein